MTLLLKSNDRLIRVVAKLDAELSGVKDEVRRLQPRNSQSSGLGGQSTACVSSVKDDDFARVAAGFDGISKSVDDLHVCSEAQRQQHGCLARRSEWNVQKLEEDVMVRLRSLEELLKDRVECHQGMLQAVHTMMDNTTHYGVSSGHQV